jgi:hypothetical protein
VNFLYKPFGIVAGLIGAKLGRRAFNNLWANIDPEPTPEATAGDAPLVKVVAAAALEAATMAAIAATVDRAAARSFHYLFGAWPGKSRQQKIAEADEAG